MADFLRSYQRDAVSRMRNGCILNGGVGSGKSRTGLYYYFKEQGGSIRDQEYHEMKNPKDLYIITTAQKRDKLEWESELANFMLSAEHPELSRYNNKVVVDSWQNIKKYKDIKNAFFIFDEDKVTGYGVWVKSFLKIAKFNDWIILSATAGDCYMDYMPVFIANGFYRNKTEFIESHVEYDRFVSFPKIKCYHNTGRLLRLKNKVLIEMKDLRKTTRHNEIIFCDYDKELYKSVFRDRWNWEKNQPIQNVSELCHLARKVVNSDISRITKVCEILLKHHKAIIFYNFDYELEILRTNLEEAHVPYSEWNGHQHSDILADEPCWAYLVQYNGAEGWNCTITDTIIFYSQTYSYKTLEQASGRIDRMNTPFLDLYYYHLKSHSPIDVSISKALERKKKFNESKFIDSLHIFSDF